MDRSTARSPRAPTRRPCAEWLDLGYPGDGARMRLTATRGSHPTPNAPSASFVLAPTSKPLNCPLCAPDRGAMRTWRHGPREWACVCPRAAYGESSRVSLASTRRGTRLGPLAFLTTPVMTHLLHRHSAAQHHRGRGKLSGPPPRRPWPRTTERQAAAAASTEFQAACPSRRCHRSVIPHVWLPPFPRRAVGELSGACGSIVLTFASKGSDDGGICTARCGEDLVRRARSR
jgi:hypothetical protein